MKCEKCGHTLKVVKTSVIGNGVYRTRVCLKCSYAFKTAEVKWEEKKETPQPNGHQTAC